MVVVADPELLFGSWSNVVVVADAVFWTVPVVPGVILSTTANVAEALLARVVIVHVSGVLDPGAGALHVNAGPAVCATETQVVPTGGASVNVTLSAPTAPMLATVTV